MRMSFYRAGSLFVESVCCYMIICCIRYYNNHFIVVVKLPRQPCMYHLLYLFNRNKTCLKNFIVLCICLYNAYMCQGSERIR